MSGPAALIAALCLLLPAGLRAHGLTAEIVSSERSVTVRCAYTNGDPAQAEVLVHSPADATRYFAIIRTDQFGVAQFEPDAEGQWRLTVDDGLGHRANLRFTVDEEGAVRSTAGRAQQLGRYLALTLVCVGLLVWWRRLKRKAST